MHLFSPEVGLMGTSGIVGPCILQAAGAGYSFRLIKSDNVAVAFFGDGAVNNAAFHEGLNLAAIWKLPVLFVCENNLYAMGTALSRSQVETDLALRAASYEMPSWSVDGMDVLATAQAARRAVEAVRAGSGPHFLECRTYRFRAHSMYDPDLYRDKAEIQHWKERDPLVLLEARLRTGAFDDDCVAAMEAEITAEIDDAVAFAEAGTDEPVSELTRFLCSEDDR
jgi:pyruvate dehydrogenase E1 component alpha subunit